MKEVIKYLKGELSGITIKSQKINFVTNTLMPIESSISFRYVIKNRLGQIVAAGSVFQDDLQLQQFLLKVNAGFSHNIFYQTSEGHLWLKKPNISEVKIDKQILAQELKIIDPLLKTENEILIDDLRAKILSVEKEFKIYTIDKQELIDGLERKQNEYSKELEKKNLTIERFQAFEKERISFELDRLENKDKFIQQAFDIFNPSPENQWVEFFYGKNATDKVRTSKWVNNSKIKISVNFYYQKWFLKVDLFDWDGEQRCDVFSDSRYFEYSQIKKEFLPIQNNQQIPFWLAI